ncbi:MAG: hypothetical protein VX777_08115 [Chlamydiota bacterium]|nr:hypothetical protein [Chlamydiota bacterium]
MSDDNIRNVRPDLRPGVIPGTDGDRHRDGRPTNVPESKKDFKKILNKEADKDNINELAKQMPQEKDQAVKIDPLTTKKEKLELFIQETTQPELDPRFNQTPTIDKESKVAPKLGDEITTAPAEEPRSKGHIEKLPTDAQDSIKNQQIADKTRAPETFIQKASPLEKTEMQTPASKLADQSQTDPTKKTPTEKSLVSESANTHNLTSKAGPHSQDTSENPKLTSEDKSTRIAPYKPIRDIGTSLSSSTPRPLSEVDALDKTSAKNNADTSKTRNIEKGNEQTERSSLPKKQSDEGLTQGLAVGADPTMLNAGTPQPSAVAPIAEAGPAPGQIGQQIQSVINQIVEHMSVVTTPDQIDTKMTIKNIEGFNGVTITVTSFPTARGEINIIFENLTQEGKNLLDISENNTLLKQGLDQKGYTVHMITTTTSTIDRTFTDTSLAQRQDRGDSREEQSDRRQQQQQNEERD